MRRAESSDTNSITALEPRKKPSFHTFVTTHGIWVSDHEANLREPSAIDRSCRQSQPLGNSSTRSHPVAAPHRARTPSRVFSRLSYGEAARACTEGTGTSDERGGHRGILTYHLVITDVDDKTWTFDYDVGDDNLDEFHSRGFSLQRPRSAWAQARPVRRRSRSAPITPATSPTSPTSRARTAELTIQRLCTRGRSGVMARADGEVGRTIAERGRIGYARPYSMTDDSSHNAVAGPLTPATIIESPKHPARTPAHSLPAHLESEVALSPEQTVKALRRLDGMSLPSLYVSKLERWLDSKAWLYAHQNLRVTVDGGEVCLTATPAVEHRSGDHDPSANRRHALRIRVAPSTSDGERTLVVADAETPPIRPATVALRASPLVVSALGLALSGSLPIWALPLLIAAVVAGTYQAVRPFRRRKTTQLALLNAFRHALAAHESTDGDRSAYRREGG